MITMEAEARKRALRKKIKEMSLTLADDVVKKAQARKAAAVKPKAKPEPKETEDQE